LSKKKFESMTIVVTERTAQEASGKCGEFYRPDAKKTLEKKKQGKRVKDRQFNNFLDS
jgi:hypothetical protein